MKKMIKIISVFLVFVLLFSSIAVSADMLSDLELGGEGNDIVSSGKWAYVRNGSGIDIIAYKCDVVNLVIPEEIDGLPVYGLVLHDKDYINESSEFPHFENKIETLTLPKTLRYIEYDWFAGTPESDLYDPAAFESGTRFNSLHHEDGTEYLSGYFKCGMPYLKEIMVDEDNEYFASQDGVLFNKDKTVLIAYPQMKQVDEYVVPESVKVIYDYAFQPANYPNEVYDQIDENGVHYLPNSFAMCKKLVITKNIKKIGNFIGGDCETVVIDNVKLDKQSISLFNFNAKEIIVYKDSLVHKYYKDAIAKTTLKNPPQLTVVDNPYAKKEESKGEEEKYDKLSPQTDDNITTVAMLLFVTSLTIIILGISKKHMKVRCNRKRY